MPRRIELTGFVTSHNAPLDSARVEYLTSLDSGFCYTDTAGYYSLSLLANLEYRIYYYSLKYQDSEHTVTAQDDTLINIDLEPIDYYPSLSYATWIYHYSHHYFVDCTSTWGYRDMVIERTIIEVDSTYIRSNIHGYGQIQYHGHTDTTDFDTTYVFLEEIGNNYDVNTFLSIFRPPHGFTNLLLNKYLHTRYNEGKTSLNLDEPLEYKVYTGDTKFNGLECLYLRSAYLLDPYFLGTFYCADSIGLIELDLEYAGTVDCHNTSIKLLDFKRSD
jgi:hypothetical protein